MAAPLPAGLEWQYSQAQAGDPRYTHLLQLYNAPGVMPAQNNLVGNGLGTPSASAPPLTSAPTSTRGGSVGGGFATPPPPIAPPLGAPPPQYVPPAQSSMIASPPPAQAPNLLGQGLPNADTSAGGINTGLIPGMLSNQYGISYPASYTAAQNSGTLNQYLQNLFGDQAGEWGGFLNQFNPVQQGNLQYLAQNGIPGSSQIQQQQQQFGQGAGNLLGTGGDGTYGLQQMLSQIMQQGLPGQQNIQNLIGNFSNQAMGGGLTPEYVKAQRSLVLDPSREALQGNLNRMGGGTASLTSPAFQELLKRQEDTFNNQLLSQGFNNTNQFANTAMNAFGSVASQNAPYANLAGSVGSQLGSQALQDYMGYGNLGLNNLSTIQGLANQPYNTAMGGLQQLLGGQQSYGTNQQQISNDLLRQLVGIYGIQNAPSNTLPSILGGLFGLGSAAINNSGGNSGGGGGATVGGGIGDWLRGIIFGGSTTNSDPTNQPW